MKLQIMFRNSDKAHSFTVDDDHAESINEFLDDYDGENGFLVLYLVDNSTVRLNTSQINVIKMKADSDD